MLDLAPPQDDPQSEIVCNHGWKTSEQAMDWLLSWWGMTTSVDYLQSGPSRRDMWAVFLPLTGVLAMFGDAPDQALIVLDACLAMALIGAAWLPARTLMSDIAVAFTYAVYMALRGLLVGEDAHAYGACQAVAMLGMAASGIHTLPLAGFLALSAFAAPLLGARWSIEVILTCMYILGLSCFVERRIAQAISAGGLIPTPGYKALEFNTSRSTVAGMVDSLPPGSDGEDLQGEASRRSSRSYVAEYVMSHFPMSSLEKQKYLSGQLTSGSNSPDSRSRERAYRFEAKRLGAIKAAGHDPPDFDDDVGPVKKPFAERPVVPPLESEPAEKESATEGLRAVKLIGFRASELNVLFVERQASEFFLNGRETFWNSTNDYFLYYSKLTNTWGAAKAKRFQQVQNGKSHGVAHGPEGVGIWDSSLTKGWREWDSQASKWTVQPEAGVESRGKVRPLINSKNPKVEKGVQTDPWKP